MRSRVKIDFLTHAAAALQLARLFSPARTHPDPRSPHTRAASFRTQTRTPTRTGTDIGAILRRMPRRRLSRRGRAARARPLRLAQVQRQNATGGRQTRRRARVCAARERCVCIPPSLSSLSNLSISQRWTIRCRALRRQRTTRQTMDTIQMQSPRS